MVAWSRILLALLPAIVLSASSSSAQEETTRFTGDGPLIERNLEGWTVYVDPRLIEGPDAELGSKALRMLENHLFRISLLIPAEPLTKLRKVGIRLDLDHPGLSAMQYHPSEAWLRDHGHDPRLTRQVHLPQARDLLSREELLKHPAVVLHELAHAYHDQFLGFDHPEIEQAFKQASAEGQYERVLLYTGEEVKHYGMTDAKEYFAEATEAFFYRNDFYPFVRAELERHDPRMHAVLKKVWEGEATSK